MLEKIYNSPELNWMLIITALIVLIAVIINLIVEYNDFSTELKYLKLEINRTRGDERKYFIKKKRILVLSYIFPFIKY